jgi:hypothetical protein
VCSATIRTPDRVTSKEIVNVEHEAQHRVILLFNPRMNLARCAGSDKRPVKLQRALTVQTSVAAMVSLGAKRFADRAPARIVPVGGHLDRGLVDNRESATEEALGSVHVPRGTQEGVHQIAFSIRGAIKIAPLAFDLQVGLIYISTPAYFELAFTPDFSANSGANRSSHSRTGSSVNAHPRRRNNLGQIPQAEFIP